MSLTSLRRTGTSIFARVGSRKGTRLRASALGTKSKVFPFPIPSVSLSTHVAHSPYRFISAVHIPRDPAAHDILISGGGDPMIKVWQWRAGRRIYDVAIEEIVRPFIAVRRAQPKRGYDSDGERKPPSRRWLARQRRKEAKAAAAATKLPEDDVDTVPEAEAEGAEAEVDLDLEDADVDGDERIESEDETVDVSVTPTRASGDPEEPPPAPVLVVQKIESLKIDGQLVIVFSAVGCVSSRMTLLSWPHLRII